jgi:hypothetical protein
MSKRKRRDRNTGIMTARASSSTAITNRPTSPTSAGGQAGAAEPDTWWALLRWGGLVFVVSLGLAAVWFAYQPARQKEAEDEKKPATLSDLLARLKKQGKRDNWKPPAWEALTEEDKLVDRFVALKNRSDPAALKSLSALPAGPADGDAEFDRRVVGHYLHHAGLRLVDIWKGDLGSDGKPRPAAGFYVLVTKGTVTSPPIPVRDSQGAISKPQTTLINPGLVVQVKNGVIHPVRSAML